MIQSIRNLALTTFIGKIAGRISSYGMVLLLAWRFGPIAVGIFSFGKVTLQIGKTLSTAGLVNIAQKYVSIYRSNDDQPKLNGLILACIGVVTVLGVAFSAILYLNNDIVSVLSGESNNNFTEIFAIGIPFFAIATISAAITRGFKRAKYSVYILDIGFFTASFLITGAIVILNPSFELVVFGYVGATVLSALLGIYALTRFDLISLDSGFDFELRSIIPEGARMFGIGISQQSVVWADIVFLAYLTSAGTVGRYEVAYQTAALLGFALVAVNSVFPAIAAGLYNDNEIEQLSAYYKAITKWITYLTVIAASGLVLFGRAYVGLLSEEFVSIVPVLAVLAAARVVAVGTGPAGMLLMMADQERTELLNSAAVAIANLILNFVLVSRYGMFGAAIASSLSLSVVNIIRALQVRHYLSIAPYDREIFDHVWGVGAAIGGIAVVRLVGGLSLGVAVIAGIAGISIFILSILKNGLSERDMSLVHAVE